VIDGIGEEMGLTLQKRAATPQTIAERKQVRHQTRRDSKYWIKPVRWSILAAFAFAPLWGYLAQPVAGRRNAAATSLPILIASQQPSRPIVLNAAGRRGAVRFSHQKHEAQVFPDPSYLHPSSPGVACVGCHHKVERVTEAKQFQKCSACHKAEGDLSNPEDKEGFELSAREIYHRACIGCHRANNLRASNERLTNVSFTRCSECHDRQAKVELAATQADEQPPKDEEPGTPANIVSPPVTGKVTQVLPDAPLGYAGPSGISRRELISPERIPIPDRWRIGFPEDPRYQKGSLLNPYRQNYLKGDYPIIGQHTFLNLTLESDSLLNVRRLPGSIDAQQPGNADLFSRGGQISYRQNFTVSLELFHGDTAFKPVDWKINITPQFNLNYLHTQRAGIVNVDPTKGNSRVDGYAALQTVFGEVRLGDTPKVFPFLRARDNKNGESPYFDSTSIRAGIQPFVSDFRGFIFSDTNLGVRLFGNYANNQYQFNAAYFQMLEKDTNSELNTPHFRDQMVLVANLYRQDTKWKGYTALFSFHFNHDKPSRHVDQNGFLVRPALIGEPVPHEVNVAYFGWAGEGHAGRLNLTHAFYQALGHDSRNPIAGRPVRINAQMAAIETSLSRDWLGFKGAFFYASGDKRPLDGTARGFDAILDLPEFAGSRFSFWNNQGIRLTRTGVNLVNSGSLLPNLRSSKFAGQANFVNPGIFVYNTGMDLNLTAKIKAILNFNYLRFHHTEPLEALLQKRDVSKEIGFDFGAGVRLRPFLNENAIIDLGYSSLVTGTGFKNIYGANCVGTSCITGSVLHSVFMRLKLTY
jgi:hypothetical protein